MSTLALADRLSVLENRLALRRYGPPALPPFELRCGHVLDELKILPTGSVHTVVTSPPYYGLRNYGTEPTVWKHFEKTALYGDDLVRWTGSLGLEPSISLYVTHLVQVFEALRRVLRDDGSVWLNIGDSYLGSGRGPQGQGGSLVQSYWTDDAHRDGLPLRGQVSDGLKPKDLALVPYRVAAALQAAGWWLRADVIWSKPNPMPESVRDRPTTSHEHVFLLTKSARYYYDALGASEPATGGHASGNGFAHRPGERSAGGRGRLPENDAYATRNLRSVWTIPPQPSRYAHYATFPEALVERCLAATLPAYGVCPQCGAPWVRITERSGPPPQAGPAAMQQVKAGGVQTGGTARSALGTKQAFAVEHRGWQPSCRCGVRWTTPATALDPFCGIGTTGVVAQHMGGAFVGVDLNAAYLEEAERRLRAAETPP